MIELASLAGGYIFGLLKLMYLEHQKNQRVLFQQIKENNETNLRLLELEAKNDKISSTKRFITVAFVLAFIWITAVAPVLYPEVAINVLTEVKTGGRWFFGIFDNSATKMVYEKVNGIIFDDTMRQVILAIVGNYFGQRR